MNCTEVAHWWNRVRYRAYAPVYDWLAWPMERGRKRAVRALAPEAGARILLVGGGTGADLQYLPPAARITVLDAVPAMVRRAKARADALGMNVEARVGDARALPFDENAFDLVLLHLFLSVVSDPAAVLHETARVLRRGGRVSIYDKFVPPGTTASLFRRALNPLARILVSDFMRRLEPMLAETGFEKEAHRQVGRWGLYTATVARPAERHTPPAGPSRAGILQDEED